MKTNIYKIALQLFIIVSANASPFIMGGTYDTMSDHATSIDTCLLPAKDFNNIQIINPTAIIDFSQDQSLQSVQNALGVNYDSHIDYGAFELNTAYSYAKTSRNDAYTINLNYIYKYSGKAVFKQGSIKGVNSLIPEALKLVAEYPKEFRQLCGDAFIGEIDAGASILFRLSLKFDSPVEKDYFDNGFNKIGGLSNIIDRVRQNPHEVNYNLTASGIQVGGDSSKFNQLFLQHNGYINNEGYPELNCKSGAGTTVDSQCISIISEIINYATGIKSQLQQPKDFFYSNPTISSWSSIAIFPSPVEPDPTVLKAMEDLSIQYNQDDKDMVFIDNYQRMLKSKNLLSDMMQQDLTKLSSLYHSMLNVYKDPANHALDCYDGFVSTICLTIKDNLFTRRSQILNNDRLNQLLSYLKSNQFITALLISDNINENSSCLLSPITDDNSYMLNCNGQITGSFTDNNPIKIIKNIKTVTLKDLQYKYNSNRFHYSFKQPLVIDNYYPNSYVGDASITINDAENEIRKRFALINTDILIQ